MSEIAAFLSARYDEQEADAQDSRALSPGDLHWSMPGWLDRDYLLADIAAKRQILVLHHREVMTSDGSMPDECYHCCEPWICPTVRLLAAPFAGHPDYRDEWKIR